LALQEQAVKQLYGDSTAGDDKDLASVSS
jgi:hypothetical protein